jgi:Arc/MetJ family transcription regulator
MTDSKTLDKTKAFRINKRTKYIKKPLTIHTIIVFYMYYGGYMRTTLVLPDTLVSEAMLITNSPTKTALIKTALENLIQREKVRGITDYFGKVNLNIDIEKMRQR